MFITVEELEMQNKALGALIKEMDESIKKTNELIELIMKRRGI